MGTFQGVLLEGEHLRPYLVNISGAVEPLDLPPLAPASRMGSVRPIFKRDLRVKGNDKN